MYGDKTFTKQDLFGYTLNLVTAKKQYNENEVGYLLTLNNMTKITIASCAYN